MTAVTRAWISAARPRTLPLSISGILVGSSYAYLDIAFAKANFSQIVLSVINLELTFNWWIPILALITTLGFQILSNFANDYGDGVKGTDNEDRIGPMRAIQSGLIAPSQMKKAIIVTAILVFVCAVLLIYVSLGIDQLLISILYLGLGIAAIWAAIKYTIGDNAYGYRGLGDLFVFIFFGPVSVMGIYFLITERMEWELLLPSITIGLMSTAVLNLNNMRDIESDKKAGKNTLPVQIGLDRSKKLHYAVLITAAVCMCLFSFWIYDEANHTSSNTSIIAFLPLLAFIPLAIHTITVYKNNSAALLDPELKKVALSTFLLALLCIVSTAVLVW
ncbi:1,4-dihydroxy-2-naphthoate octaprenyltransferase [Nonlabens marinus]|uniref:1,4-dihydroxy-2-naphthoate octaprenyltransferase n=1 Tax=Nonlabens marinus S1-08 TaxID=1454201 RepID=W8VS81_9FLAO|nr:1,4-dihydroxy-2-naphthoate octaprenyltransferase [Nonlabens marinus]BAO56704.1 1,4-dihydroxy-2-naphthoate octaprenyltransferase [Nonlabens marinus S1-08]